MSNSREATSNLGELIKAGMMNLENRSRSNSRKTEERDNNHTSKGGNPLIEDKEGIPSVDDGDKKDKRSDNAS